MRFEFDREKSRDLERKHGVRIERGAENIRIRATIRNNFAQSVGVVMAKMSRKIRTADEIAEMASRGEDISAHFTNAFTVVRPVRRVNVDLTQGMLRELDERAARLNISRQAVIKTLLGRALNEERENKLRPKKAG